MLDACLTELAALRRARRLLWLMALREAAMRHAGSLIGIGWLYAQPALTLAVYYLVFDVVFGMRLGEEAPVRAVGTFLIVGMLPWMAFGDALSRGMNALVEAGGLLQKNALPPALFPARAVLASTLVYAPLLMVLALAYTPVHGLAPALLVMPLLFAGQVMLALLLGYVLAILAAAVRDVLQVVGFMLAIGVFTAPVLFPAALFPEGLRALLWFNPMTPLVLGYQSILLEGRWPAWETWAGLVLWLGGLVFLLELALRRSREQLVDWL